MRILYHEFIRYDARYWPYQPAARDHPYPARRRFLTGSAFRDRIENSGAKFVSLQGRADFDGRDFLGGPELDIPPGLEWFRVAIERIFVDSLPAQHQGLPQALEECQADVIVGDDMFFDVLPMLLGSQSKRPPLFSAAHRLHLA